MEIRIENKYGYTYLIIEEDDLIVDELLTQYLIEKDTNANKLIYVGKDVSDEWIEKVLILISDLAEYRIREFDSSSLITQLFTKLPEDIRNQLLMDLNEKY